jgi:isopentenyl diphosphate isomerase/L-lactate dehydrogenase-like FMN-dependent dehydrogenase
MSVQHLYLDGGIRRGMDILNALGLASLLYGLNYGEEG